MSALDEIRRFINPSAEAERYVATVQRDTALETERLRSYTELEKAKIEGMARVSSAKTKSEAMLEAIDKVGGLVVQAVDKYSQNKFRALNNSQSLSTPDTKSIPPATQD